MNDLMSREDLIVFLTDRDGPDCFLCRKPFSRDTNSVLFEKTIDHWYPQSVAYAQGWTYEEVNDPKNLRLAHKPCNSAKGDIVPNADGTLPKRDVKERAIRLPRPSTCDTCANGRLLLLGEECYDCGSGPQPLAFPKTLQKEPKQCDHSRFHCWMCVIGHIPRKSAFSVIITGE